MISVLVRNSVLSETNLVIMNGAQNIESRLKHYFRNLNYKQN